MHLKKINPRLIDAELILCYYEAVDGGVEMAVSYIRLWKKLIDKRLKKTDLKELANISNSTLAKLGKDEYISMEIIERICVALDCRIEDIMEFTSEEPEV